MTRTPTILALGGGGWLMEPENTLLAPNHDGLGFLPGSHCPHFDGEARRRPRYTALVGDGTLPPGIAADDGAGLVFRGTELAEVVSSRPGASAWRVTTEGPPEPIPTRYLG